MSIVTPLIFPFSTLDRPRSVHDSLPASICDKFIFFFLLFTILDSIFFADSSYLSARLLHLLYVSMINLFSYSLSPYLINFQRYRKEMLERKKLHNLVQELKGNIRVYMRYE